MKNVSPSASDCPPRKLAELHSCIHVAPGFSPVSKLTPTSRFRKNPSGGGMSPESTKRVRAEARGHMKTSTVSSPADSLNPWDLYSGEIRENY